MKRALVSIPYGLGFRHVAGRGVLESLARRGVAAHLLLPELVDEVSELRACRFAATLQL